MVSFTVCMVLCSRYKSQSQVCKGSACTMLAVVALDPVWAALCWSVCPWITARRARSLSQCGAAHRWPPQWSSPITQCCSLATVFWNMKNGCWDVVETILNCNLQTRFQSKVSSKNQPVLGASIPSWSTLT